MFDKLKAALDMDIKGPRRITLAKVIKILDTDDKVYISSDYHFMKRINKKHKQSAYDAQVKKEEEILEMHNNCVRKNDIFLFLGDIAESNLMSVENMKELIRMCRQMNGSKIAIIRGNNDELSDDFYYECGFQCVADEIVCPKRKIIFSHVPVDWTDKEHSMYSKDWINIHGHIHGSFTYWNRPAERHIDVYWGIHNNKVLRLPQYIQKYKNGFYNDNHTEYKPFWN